MLTIVALIGSAQENVSGLNDTYWRNELTGDWMVGVTKNHIIFDNKVWDVVSVSSKKDNYTLTLNDGLMVRVGKLKNGLRKMTIGDGKPIECSPITTAAMPDYPTKDLRRGFADNGYSDGDSVTIVGWLKDMPQEE